MCRGSAATKSASAVVVPRSQPLQQHRQSSVGSWTLSRDTYAKNKHLVDELIDTSLHRGRAPVRQRDGYYEDGGTFSTNSTSATSTASSAPADSQELIQAVRQVETAIKALPSWVRIYWDQDDTAAVETLLDERAADRAAGEVR